MSYPKTRQGLIDLIISQISKFDTTYVSFCAEMEAATNQKELDWYCNRYCAIHDKHVSKGLLCLPLSTKKTLSVNGKVKS